MICHNWESRRTTPLRKPYRLRLMSMVFRYSTVPGDSVSQDPHRHEDSRFQWSRSRSMSSSSSLLAPKVGASFPLIFPIPLDLHQTPMNEARYPPTDSPQYRSQHPPIADLRCFRPTSDSSPVPPPQIRPQSLYHCIRTIHPPHNPPQHRGPKAPARSGRDCQTIPKAVHPS